ncbi:MAG: tetratricopeptide repeat protein [Bacteroidota bacterium]
MKLSFQKVLLTMALTAGITMFTFAQSVDEAGEALNKAIELKKAEKFEDAAVAFEQALDIADMVGPDAFDIKSTAQKQIPVMYFKAAAEAYKAKDYVDAADKFKIASEMAEKYDNQSLAEKAGRNVPALYNSIANSYRKKKEFDQALNYFDQAIDFKDDYAKAYLGKLLVYRDNGDDDKMIEMADKINELDKGGESQNSANNIIQTFYLKKAKTAVDGERNSDALNHMKSYMEYGEPDAQGYYVAALVYNANKQFEDAQEAASSGLNTSPDEDLMANLYFELGNAYKGQDKVSDACSAYSNALGGPNGEAAKYQMEEVLECD